MQRCPFCDEPIGRDAINIAEGVALCPGCGRLARLSELHSSQRSIEEIVGAPPPGCWTSSEGAGVRVIASARSLRGFVLMTGIALFWNGCVSVFVLFVSAGLYFNLVGPLPEWFPSFILEDGKPILNGAPIGLGMSLVLCAFLIPFVVRSPGVAESRSDRFAHTEQRPNTSIGCSTA